MEWLRTEQWPVYVVGIGIGILSWLAFFLSDHPLGCSTAFARTSGMIEKLFRGRKVEERTYFKRFAPIITWEWILVLGIVIGAFLSAKLSNQFRFYWIPTRWQVMIGDTRWIRWLTALMGGVVMGFGARWAGGCTSGHGISGTLQLAVSSWLATICFFIGGVITTMLIAKVFSV